MPPESPSTPSDYDEPVWDAAALAAVDAAQAAFFDPDPLLPVSLSTTSTCCPAHLAIEYEGCPSKLSNSPTASSTSSEKPTQSQVDPLKLNAQALQTHSPVVRWKSPRKNTQESAWKNDSLYNRFRAKRGFLSVSDIVACAWCETQVEYGLLGQRHLKPAQRPTSFRTAAGTEIKVDTQRVVSRQKILDGGTSVHAKLEKEVAPERVEVKVTTQVDAWGLRIMNTIINLALLRTNGMMREINVWGFVGDFLVQGVIDQIELTSNHAPRPGPPGRKRLASSKQASLDAYLSRPSAKSDKVENTHHGGGEISNRPGVRISDSKTVQGTTLPPHSYTQSPRYQLMLYKYMYDQMANGSFDSARLAAHLSLDLTEPFSPAFLRDLEPVLRSAQDPSTDQLFGLPTNLGEMFGYLQQEIAKIGVSDDRLEIVYRERGHVKKKSTTAKGTRKKKAKTGHSAQRNEADGKTGVFGGAIEGGGERIRMGADDRQLQEAIRLSLADAQESAARRSLEGGRPGQGTEFSTNVDAGRAAADEDDKELQEAIKLSLADAQAPTAAQSAEGDRPDRKATPTTGVDASPAPTTDDGPLEKRDRQLIDTVCSSSTVDGGLATLADDGLAKPKRTTRRSSDARAPHARVSSLHRHMDPPGTITESGVAPSAASAPAKRIRGRRRASSAGAEKAARASDETEPVSSASAVDAGQELTVVEGVPTAKRGKRRSSAARTVDAEEHSASQEEGDTAGAGEPAAAEVATSASVPAKRVRSKRRVSCASAAEVSHGSQEDTKAVLSAVEAGEELTVDNELPTAERGKRRSSALRAAEVEELSGREGDGDMIKAGGAAAAVATSASFPPKQVRGKRRASSGSVLEVGSAHPAAELTSSAVEIGAVTTPDNGESKPVRPKRESSPTAPPATPQSPVTSTAPPAEAAPAGESARSATLASMVANYERKKTGADDGVIGSLVFTYNYQELNSFVNGALEFWSGKRAARGVPISEFNRCGPCEFRSGCEWRNQKSEEIASLAIQKTNLERQRRGLKEI